MAINYEGKESMEVWFKQVEEKIQELKQPVNVYFFATGCGMDSYGRSRNKLLRFSEKYAEFSFVEDREALKRNSYIAKSMALKTSVASIEELKEKWQKLFGKKLTASCGCSIFISDAQEIRISVLEPNCRFGWE